MVNRNRYLLALFSLALILPVGSNALAADKAEYMERARKAGETLTEVMGAADNAIPDELLQRAHAIAVIPGVKKGAFGIGGRWGKGLVSHRSAAGKWSTPSFIEMGGASVGFQIGVESSDLILVFMNDEGFRSMLKGKVKLGADAAVAAGPVGRKAEVGTDVRMTSAILSYSRSKGLFAGVALDGAVISIDDSANEKTY